MVEVREDKIANYIDQVQEIAEENWAETGFDFPLDIDIDTYKKAEEIGLMHGVGAFDGDKLVGYCTFSVAPSLFNRGVRMGHSDALYLRKEYRTGRTLLKLIAFAEGVARREGAQWMLWHARGDTPFVMVLQKRGYELADSVLKGRL